MRRRALRLILAAAALAVAPAAALAQDDQEPVKPPRILRDAVARWEAAFDSDDPGRVAGRYLPDAWLKPPCAVLSTGRDAIARQWREILSYSPVVLTLEPRSFELSRSRDMAIERGAAHLNQNVGGLPYGTNVEYMRVWRRAGREWLIAADLFTPGGPCAAEE